MSRSASEWAAPGGQIEEIQGGFGTELLAKLPASGAEQEAAATRVARFMVAL